ncbi:MAG: hypothetical protein L0Z50_15430 [Verrucomicrobiales bacterium]|nr:hypothetical protein [Verrucomicrobiales bacterium]
MSHRPPTNQVGQQQRVAIARTPDVFDRSLEMEDGMLRQGTDWKTNNKRK